jgi:hypothetical protein
MKAGVVCLRCELPENAFRSSEIILIVTPINFRKLIRQCAYRQKADNIEINKGNLF